jgi:hypothetical protein
MRPDGVAFRPCHSAPSNWPTRDEVNAFFGAATRSTLRQLGARGVGYDGLGVEWRHDDVEPYVMTPSRRGRALDELRDDEVGVGRGREAGVDRRELARDEAGDDRVDASAAAALGRVDIVLAIPLDDDV